MPGESAPEITTPDRRVRVFVSSTLQELADERAAVRAAVARLRLTPVMFELGARPHPPRELYRAYLAQSDVFVGIYWRRCGWVAPGEPVSGLEDEYLLSGERPKLIYVKAADDREPRLTELLGRIQADDRAAYKPFGTAAELADLVADDLAVLLTERFARPAGDAPHGLRTARLLMPPTGIVGREAEAAAVGALLADPAVRLVTLVGPGGIGKTRLALEVAHRLTGEGGGGWDGVWFVDLAPLTDPAQVPGALAAALGVRPEGTGPVLDLLVDRLQGRRVLLVLDGWGLAFALSTRGQVALQDGDPAVAAALHREGLAAERIDNDFLRAQALDLLGLAAMAAGDLAEARSRFAAAAQVHARLLDQEGSAYCLGGFAAVAFRAGPGRARGPADRRGPARPGGGRGRGVAGDAAAGRGDGRGGARDRRGRRVRRGDGGGGGDADRGRARVRPRGHRMRAVVVVAVAALAVGCSSPRKGPAPPVTFAGAEVQRTIDAELPRTFDGLRVGAARCPDRLDPAQDRPGVCSVTVEGVPVRVRVDRQGTDRYTVTTDQAVIPVARLEASLQPAVSERGKQTYSVDCGDEAVRVFDPPGKVRCVARPARGAPVGLVVTVADREGNYTFEPEEDS